MAQEIADSTLLDTWASSGLIVEPDISKIIEGWQLGEQPPHEYMNWLQNTFGSKLNHILKNGVAKWNNETEYLAGATTQHNSSVWICKTANKNSEPTDSNSNWDKILSLENLALTVDTINDFPTSATTGNTCIVKDIDRGGIFIYDSTKVAEHNGGTNFNGWIRQFSGAVNVKWFGAKEGYENGNETTIAIQTCVNLFSSVHIPSGEYRLTSTIIMPNVFVEVSGVGEQRKGASKTVLDTTDVGTAFKSNYQLESFVGFTIKSIKFIGGKDGFYTIQSHYPYTNIINIEVDNNGAEYNGNGIDINNLGANTVNQGGWCSAVRNSRFILRNTGTCLRLYAHGGNVLIDSNDFILAKLGLDVLGCEQCTISNNNFNAIYDDTVNQAYPNNIRSSAIRVGASLNADIAVVINIQNNYIEDCTRALVVMEAVSVALSNNFITSYPTSDNNTDEDGMIFIHGACDDFTAHSNFIKQSFNKQRVFYNNAAQNINLYNNSIHHLLGTNAYDGISRFYGAIKHTHTVLKLVSSVGTRREILDNSIYSNIVPNYDFRDNKNGWSNGTWAPGLLTITNGGSYYNTSTYLPPLEPGTYYAYFDINNTDAGVDKTLLRIYNQTSTSYIGRVAVSSAGKYRVKFNISNSNDVIKCIIGFDLSNAGSQTIGIKSVTISKSYDTNDAIVSTLSGNELPTSDPHIDGALWRNSNIVTVSQG